MKRIACLGASLALASAFAFAAGGGAVPAIAYDNVHIRVSDPAEAGKWYVKYLGARATSSPNRVYIGKTLINFLVVPTEQIQQSAGGVGVIDHIGLSFADLNVKMQDLQTGGAKVVAPLRDTPGLFKSALIEDPWGVKVEVVQDPKVLGFHHVHLQVPDPEASLKWYQEMLGGERGKLKGRIEGLRYGDVWLLVAKSGRETPAPIGDGAILLVAWRVPNVVEAAAVFKSKGVKSFIEPRKNAQTGVWIAMFEDPNGVKVELLHRPPEVLYR